jgi:hypothetical protein
MHGFCSVAKKQAHVTPYFLLSARKKVEQLGQDG